MLPKAHMFGLDLQRDTVVRDGIFKRYGLGSLCTLDLGSLGLGLRRRWLD